MALAARGNMAKVTTTVEQCKREINEAASYFDRFPDNAAVQAFGEVLKPDYKGSLHISFRFLYGPPLTSTILHNHNEQFFQVGLLDRALISLGLALSPPSISVSSDLVVLCKCFLVKIILTYFTIPCRGLISLVGLALYLVD